MDLSELRNEYKHAELDIEHVHVSPFIQFDHWFKEATDSEIIEPNAFCLSTVNEEGQPSARTVLLKYYDEKGFIFYTNLESQKSKDILVNPRVSILFTWLELERQIRIEGIALKVPITTSMKYFNSRPRGSQLGAWVSNQSSIISSKSILMAKYEEMKKKFSNGEIPLPSFWGGYQVLPTRFEFWQGRQNRLHDRVQYLKSDNNSWDINLLAP